MSALAKMRQSGFTVTLVDGFIEISPSSKLTDQQRQFLKSHKSVIIAELKAVVANNTDRKIEGEYLSSGKGWEKLYFNDGRNSEFPEFGECPPYFTTDGRKFEEVQDPEYQENQQVQPLEQWQKKAITAWVSSLGGSPESIAEEVGETLAQCEADAKARLYFLKRATEWVRTKPAKPIFTMCGNCNHFKPHHQHGKGSGICERRVMPDGVCHWSETVTDCTLNTGLHHD